jgi:hypothetical protein
LACRSGSPPPRPAAHRSRRCFSTCEQCEPARWMRAVGVDGATCRSETPCAAAAVAVRLFECDGHSRGGNFRYGESRIGLETTTKGWPAWDGQVGSFGLSWVYENPLRSIAGRPTFGVRFQNRLSSQPPETSTRRAGQNSRPAAKALRTQGLFF